MSKPQIPAAAQKAVAAIVAEQVEKAVAARMASVPPTTPANAGTPAPKLSIERRIGVSLQKEYAEKFGASDQAMPAAQRKSIIEKANALIGTAGQGGSLFAPEYASEVISALHERSVLKEAGATPISWSGGSLTFGRINQGVTIGWTTEHGTPTPQNIATDDLVLANRYLKGYATISNAALRAPGADLAAVVGSDVLLAFGAEIDAKFLDGDGTGGAPTGILQQLNAGQTVAATATPTVNKVRKDLASMMKRVRGAKLHFQGANPAWIMPSAEYFALLSMRDGAGNAFPSLEANGTLFGYPVHITDAIADQVVFGLMRHVLWGSSYGPQVGMGLINADLVAGTSTIFGHFVGDASVRYDRALAVTSGTSIWETVV